MEQIDCAPSVLARRAGMAALAAELRAEQTPRAKSYEPDVPPSSDHANRLSSAARNSVYLSAMLSVADQFIMMVVMNDGYFHRPVRLSLSVVMDVFEAAASKTERVIEECKQEGSIDTCPFELQVDAIAHRAKLRNMMLVLDNGSPPAVPHVRVPHSRFPLSQPDATAEAVRAYVSRVARESQCVTVVMPHTGAPAVCTLSAAISRLLDLVYKMSVITTSPEVVDFGWIERDGLSSDMIRARWPSPRYANALVDFTLSIAELLFVSSLAMREVEAFYEYIRAGERNAPASDELQALLSGAVRDHSEGFTDILLLVKEYACVWQTINLATSHVLRMLRLLVIAVNSHVPPEDEEGVCAAAMANMTVTSSPSDDVTG